jgi:hypothetical protein
MGILIGYIVTGWAALTNARFRDEWWLGISCVTIRIVGWEMWYGVYAAISVVLLCILFIGYANVRLSTYPRIPAARFTALALIIIAVLIAGSVAGVFPKVTSQGLTPNMAWCGFTLSPSINEHAADADVKNVTRWIEKQAAKYPNGATILFLPSADGLFFRFGAMKGWSIAAPWRDGRQIDLVVYHAYPIVNSWWAGLVHNATDPFTFSDQNLIQKKGSDIWYGKGVAKPFPHKDDDSTNPLYQN